MSLCRVNLLDKSISRRDRSKWGYNQRFTHIFGLMSVLGWEMRVWPWIEVFRGKSPRGSFREICFRSIVVNRVRRQERQPKGYCFPVAKKLGSSDADSASSEYNETHSEEFRGHSVRSRLNAE